MKKIYGSLICQNGVAEIARCIESVYPVVDEYFVMDGGSTDGTWEWLNKWKGVYNLTIFQHPYKDQGEQRNLLLKKIPKGVWVVNIDQDERLGLTIQCELKNFIARIREDVYTDPKRYKPG
jgi:glycosyltransferase involved in cell wall biosynthesis